MNAQIPMVGPVSTVAGGGGEACAVAGLKSVFGDRVAAPACPEANTG